MAPVANGQAVDEDVTNPAFLDAQVDDTAFGKITLANTDPASGPTVSNIQAGHNASFQDLKFFLCTADHSVVSFMGGQLFFTADILIVSKDYAIVNTILAANSPLNIADGESVYVTLQRMANANVVPNVTSLLPKGRDVFRLCTRRGSAIIFWDNTILLDQKTTRIGGSTVATGAVQEVAAGTVDGVNDTFTLSSIPPTQTALLMFIDGILVPIAGWSIVNNVVTFAAGYIPQPAQTVEAFYLVESNGPPGPIPSGTEYIEYPILTGPQIAAKQLTLVALPATPAKVMVDVIGDGAQVYGADFVVSGQTLDWNGLGLDGYVSAGDQLRIHYFT